MRSDSPSVLAAVEDTSAEPELADAAPGRAHAIQRLEQADLLEQIRFERRSGLRFHGTAHHRLFDDLWLYAWPVVKVFLRTNRFPGLLRDLAPSRAVSVRPEDMVVLANSDEERDVLAIDIIFDAIKYFDRQVVENDRWTGDGGASLRTWFIGTCTLQFPRAYQRWSRLRFRRLLEIAQANDINTFDIGWAAARVPDPSATSIVRAEIRSLIDSAQPTTKLILGLIMQGKTFAEIGTELRLSTRAVEGRIYRLRQKAIGTRAQARRKEKLIAAGELQ